MSALKTIRRSLPWTDRTEWLWPADDIKLLGVFEQVHDIDVVMKYLPKGKRKGVIQAGGATGIWPERFSMLFDHVFTFEPMPENYACMMHNIEGIANITATHAALTNRDGEIKMKHERTEKNNYGALYITSVDDESEQVDDEIIPCVSIDSYFKDNRRGISLIYLDIEGAELEALHGAADIIRKWKPVIALEDKNLPQMHEFNREVGDPEKWLMAEFGYVVAERIHRDTILVPGA